MAPKLLKGKQDSTAKRSTPQGQDDERDPSKISTARSKGMLGEGELATPISPADNTSGSSGTGARGKIVMKDKETVEMLAKMMMQLLPTVVDPTLDTFSQQAFRLASFGSAINATRKLDAIDKQYDEQIKRQQQGMEEVKDLLQNTLHGEKLKSEVEQKARELTKEVIKRVIEQNVNKQLQEQITKQMRDQVDQFQQQIWEVKTSLANSEARRHNALIRSNALQEPLQPLVLPLSPISPSINSTYSDSRWPGTQATEPGTSSGMATGVPALTLRTQGLPNGNNPNTGGGLSAVAPLTASTRFPRDLHSLMSLNPDEARTLMQEYGLAPIVETEGPAESPTSLHEENLNRLMAHIGVGFKVIPRSPLPGNSSAVFIR